MGRRIFIFRLCICLIYVMELLLTCIKSAVLYWAADFLMTVVVLNFLQINTYIL
nr:MAG TPA: hypothetical protein [Caudoviricetes sp.]